jgi:integrase/recombinase XerD
VDTGTKVTPRRRQICENLDAVDHVRAEWQLEFKKGGSSHSLSPSQRHDALQAYSLLEKAKVRDSLSDAVAYYLKHRYPSGGDLTVFELCEHFIAAKQTAKRVDRTTGETTHRYSYPYRQSLHKIQQLGEALANVRLSNLKASDIDKHLAKLKLGEVSRYTYFQYFKMVFNYGVKHQFLERNPMATMQSPLITRRDPPILTVEQVENLLYAAYHDHDGVVFVYTVLGFFGGIRPNEITKLKWSDFRDHGWSVRIRAENAKTRDVRVVALPVNAHRMISDYQAQFAAKNGEPDPDSLIVPLTHNLLRKRFRQAFQRAGIRVWPHDAARHTFASFYYKATKSMPKLMEQLGHSTPTTSLRHYVNLTDESWIKYFSLAATPDQEALLQGYVKECTDPDSIPDNQHPPIREGDVLKVLLYHDWKVLPSQANLPPAKPYVAEHGTL